MIRSDDVILIKQSSPSSMSAWKQTNCSLKNEQQLQKTPLADLKLLLGKVQDPIKPDLIPMSEEQMWSEHQLLLRASTQILDIFYSLSLSWRNRLTDARLTLELTHLSSGHTGVHITGTFPAFTCSRCSDRVFPPLQPPQQKSFPLLFLTNPPRVRLSDWSDRRACAAFTEAGKIQHCHSRECYRAGLSQKNIRGWRRERPGHVTSLDSAAHSHVTTTPQRLVTWRGGADRDWRHQRASDVQRNDVILHKLQQRYRRMTWNDIISRNISQNDVKLCHLPTPENSWSERKISYGNNRYG